MKHLPLLLISMVVLVSACRSKFAYTTVDPRTAPGYTPYSLANSALYVRTVCKGKDRIDTALTAPVDCNISSKNILELSFIFLNVDSSQILVINNIPNRKQTFFDEVVVEPNRNKADSVASAIINVWPFAQFRFGKFHRSDAKFRTIGRFKNKMDHVWEFTSTTDGMNITSFGVETCYGINKLYTDSTLYLAPIYRRINTWKLILQSPNADDGDFVDVLTDVYIKDQGDRLGKRRLETYFILDETVKRPTFSFNQDFKSVMFKNKRTYSYPRRKGELCRP